MEMGTGTRDEDLDGYYTDESEHSEHVSPNGDKLPGSITTTLPLSVERSDSDKPSKKPVQRTGLLTQAFALKGVSKVVMGRKEFQDVGNNLGKVVSLHLQKKGITEMCSDGLQSFWSLCHLYLYDNKIDRIVGLEYLPQLESLNLSGNQINRIEGLQNCVNLRRLYFGNNRIEVVEGLENLGMLLELHVENQRLPPHQPLLFCPNTLDAVSRKLKVLNINGNQLESLEDIASMDILDTLYAARNKLSDIDRVAVILKTLRQLRVVDFRYNSITKSAKYQERVIGNLNRIEILDSKDVNETTRCFIQRLCSRKSIRLRNQMNRVMKTHMSAATSQLLDSCPAMPPSTSELQYDSKQVDQQFPSDFQFSTPISASPPPEPPEGYIQPLSQDPSTLLNHEESSITMLLQGPSDLDTKEEVSNSVSSQSRKEQFYLARHTNEYEEGESAESMSEMAKIIFRLSNLTPSNEKSVGVDANYHQGGSKSQPNLPWTSSIGSIKESRPLSPLQNDLSDVFIGSRAIGTRRSVPLKRPMVGKLAPRVPAVGAGRTLSPLQELPTPDSSKREGQSDFQISSCALPPWPHITRKKAIGPPNVIFMS